MNKRTHLTVAEYFAGIGLVRMGLEPDGWQVVWANDISHKKYEMYLGFFPDADRHYVVEDIFNIKPSDVPATTLATCSFPCINLSLAGKMEGINGKHSSAFWCFVHILSEQAKMGCAPPLLLVENVPGWLSSNRGADFRVTVQSLNNIGYSCDVFTLDARRFTPQSRLRVFLVGSLHARTTRDSIKSIINRPRSLLSNRLKKSILENEDLRWFYIDLPEPPPLRNTGLSEVIEKLPDNDERWWSADEVSRHLEMMAPSHRERVENLIRQNFVTYRTFYRRIRNGKQRAEVRQDDIAGCLRTAVGGSAKQFVLEAGFGRIRMRTMTPREYARLQGVPDDYHINSNGTQALTGFGDAVCVPVISWISKHALVPLAKEISLTLPECYER
ncbi:MAG: DNA (cytosine-5-)-methyltransferase [Methanobacteriota archaeon]|nr:MAG: DNA (cytosine-5-)-methyltransferase [Euryarchaeota archaeon]